MMDFLDGKLKLFEKGYDNRIHSKHTDNNKLFYSTGDIHVIKLEQHEPLRMECQHFIESIIYDNKLVNGPEIGLQVVKLVEKTMHN